MSINQQQKQFIAEYIRTLDAEASLKKAGYKDRNLKSLAHKFLNDKEIVNEIRLQMKNQIESLQVHKGYVVQKLLQIAEFSLQEEDILDKEGYPTGKKKLRDSSAGIKALESLCKYLGFNSKDIQEGFSTKIITISNLDDKKI